MAIRSPLETPWGPLGLLTYTRTYARPNWLSGELETWPQTVGRIIDACQSQLNCGFSDEEAQELRLYLLSLKGMVAGRFLWQLGTPTVDRLGLLSLQNCAATTIDHPIRPFTWAMDALMLGSGVGYNLQREYVYELPKVRRASIVRKDTKDADFIVPDSREGWVELLRRTLEAYFETGHGFSYSTVCIRGQGEAIKGFGGVSSGPEILCQGIANICQVLNARVGKKARPVDVLDVMNIIGSIVVAGNVRRSAQIALGDMDDLQFLRAKRWDLGNVPNWRAMSNNSVICSDFAELPEQFWKTFEPGVGEPYGLINLRLSRAIGRVGDFRYPDPDVVAYNPCAEQSLGQYETCCLAELYLPNIETENELHRLTRLLYRVCKHSLLLDCHHPETADIVHRNMRMGIGVTGYLQASEAQRGWLKKNYEMLRAYDVEYSRKKDLNTSIKLTTVKPSGTLSLLAGVTSGCHPGYSQYYIRRIRLASSSPLVSVVKAHGYPVEYQRHFDGSLDRSTVVAEFPCAHPEGTTLAGNMTAIDQLEVVKRLQTEWSDNAVSCTVYYRPEELPEIRTWLGKNYNDTVKSVSFLLHSEHGFIQAPLEEISKQEYDRRLKLSRPLSEKSFQETGADASLDLSELECEGGSCPVK